MVELLMAEYACTLRQAVREFPLPAALAIISQRASRLGLDDGPGYVDRAYSHARNKARAWLEANFAIAAVPHSPR